MVTISLQHFRLKSSFTKLLFINFLYSQTDCLLLSSPRMPLPLHSFNHCPKSHLSLALFSPLLDSPARGSKLMKRFDICFHSHHGFLDTDFIGILSVGHPVQRPIRSLVKIAWCFVLPSVILIVHGRVLRGWGSKVEPIINPA